MTAICEACQQAFHIPHRRGARLKDQVCPRGHSGLLYAVGAGHVNGVYHYQARSNPELKFPINWKAKDSLIMPVRGPEVRAWNRAINQLGGA